MASVRRPLQARLGRIATSIQYRHTPLTRFRLLPVAPLARRDGSGNRHCQQGPERRFWTHGTSPIRWVTPIRTAVTYRQTRVQRGLEGCRCVCPACAP